MAVRDMNENVERLVDFCALNDLAIGGTLFPHRGIHKLTWCSPSGKDKNQIDHLMITSTCRQSLLDVKVKKGTDVRSDSQARAEEDRKEGKPSKTNKHREAERCQSWEHVHFAVNEHISGTLKN